MNWRQKYRYSGELFDNRMNETQLTLSLPLSYHNQKCFRWWSTKLITDSITTVFPCFGKHFVAYYNNYTYISISPCSNQTKVTSNYINNTIFFPHKYKNYFLTNKA